jgi:hypothetical protein
MAYVLLMIEDPRQRGTRTEAEGREVYGRMVTWSESLKARGLLRTSESLQGQQGAARVTVRQGRSRVVDGPFAEAKEMVGGFFLVDCETRDQAIALAHECPAAEWLTVEVRALAPCFDDSPRAAA